MTVNFIKIEDISNINIKNTAYEVDNENVDEKTGKRTHPEDGDGYISSREIARLDQKIQEYFSNDKDVLMEYSKLKAKANFVDFFRNNKWLQPGYKIIAELFN